MRIERVDDKTVKCFLSNEELEEYDIDYKDFVFRSEKAKEVVQEIMVQAQEEVGYQPPKFAFDLQIMMVPEQGMVLTFSEKEPADFEGGEQILECIKEMKELWQKMKAKVATQGNGVTKLPDTNQGSNAGQKGDAKEQEPAADVRLEEAVFVFDRMGAVMDYARIMPANLRVNSVLYCMGDAYYLHLQKGGASYERYSRACIQAMEFGRLYTAEAEKILYLQEHGECLIMEQALKKLRVDKKKA